MRGASARLVGDPAQERQPDQQDRDPDDQQRHIDFMPAVTAQDSWQWQMHASISLEDQTHENYWRQLLRWLVDGVPDSVEVHSANERVEAGETVTAVSAERPAVVFLLWGAHAQAKAGLIREAADRNGCEILLLQANHPSPLSASRGPVPFLGCGHFGRANRWLVEQGRSPVRW